MVALTINPSQPDPDDIPMMVNSQLPTKPPAIPKRIFHSIPADFDFMMNPASHPALVPINIDISNPIVLGTGFFN